MTRLALVATLVFSLVALIVYSQLQPASEVVSGFIEADEIRVGSRVGGRVAKVYVAEGQEVSAGQPLIELEPYDLLEREQQAARTLAAREADFQRLSNGLGVLFGHRSEGG